jgi:hypothetical protein
MDALFFARVRHIGSASIYNNGVVWLDSVAATDFARLRARTDYPRVASKRPKTAVDVTLVR